MDKPTSLRSQLVSLAKISQEDIDGIIQQVQQKQFSRESMLQVISCLLPPEQTRDFVDRLEKNGFWAENVVDDPELYARDQQQLDDFIADFNSIPAPKTSGINADKQLYKCLIKALSLEYEPKRLKVPKEFDGDVGSLKIDVQGLENAVKKEYKGKKMSNKMTESFQKIFAYDKKKAEGKQETSIYSHLLSIKKEFLQIDLLDLARLIQKSQTAKSEIKGKEIILFIGETGSGKTTLIKSLLGYKMGFKKYNGVAWLTTLEPIDDPKVKEMRSTPECKSVTRYVVCVKPKDTITNKEIYFVDSPGFHDTAGEEVRIANLIGMKAALKECLSMRIVIVVSKQNWGNRGMGFKQLGQTLSCLFTNFTEIHGCIVVVFNRFSKEQMNQMRNKLKNLKKQLNQEEKTDSNFVQFLKFLIEYDDEYVTYDPINGDPKSFVRDILKFKPERNAGSSFSPISVSAMTVKNQCRHMEERILHNMKEKNIGLAEELMRQLQQFKNITKDDDQIQQTLDKIKTILRKQMDQRVEKIRNSVCEKITHLEAEAGDLEQCRRHLEVLKREIDEASFIYNRLNQFEINSKIIESVKSVRSTHLQFSTENQMQQQQNMSLQMAAEIKNDSQRKVQLFQKKKALNMTIELHRANFSSNFSNDIREMINTIKRELQAAQSNYHRNFKSLLKESRYEEASQQKQRFVELCELERDAFTRENSEQAKKLNQQIQGAHKLVTKKLEELVSAAQKEIERISYRSDMEQLTEIDSQIEKIFNSRQLMRGLPRQIEDEMNGMIQSYHMKNMEKVNSIIYGIDSQFSQAKTAEAPSSTFAKKIKEWFDTLDKLKLIKSLKDDVQRKYTSVNERISNYMDSQIRYVDNISAKIRRDPTELGVTFKLIEKALNIIAALGELGGQEMVRRGSEVKSQILELCRDYTPNLTQNSLIRNIKYNSPNLKEIIKKIEEVKEMLKAFTKLKNFEDERKELEAADQSNINQITNQIKAAKNAIDRMNPGSDSKDSQDSHYSSIHFASIEQALIFLQIVGDSQLISHDLEHSPAKVLQNQKKLFGEYMKWLQGIPKRLGIKIIQSQPKQKQKLQQDLLNQSVYSQDPLNTLEEGCIKMWKTFKKALSQITQLSSKPKVMQECQLMNPRLLENSYLDALDPIQHFFQNELQQAKKGLSSEEAFKILLRKISTFGTSDGELPVCGPRVRQIVSLKSEILDLTNKFNNEAVSKVQIHFNNEEYEVLVEHMNKVKKTHTEKGSIYVECLQKLTSLLRAQLAKTQTQLRQMRRLQNTTAAIDADQTEVFVLSYKKCKGMKLMQELIGERDNRTLQESLKLIKERLANFTEIYSKAIKLEIENKQYTQALNRFDKFEELLDILKHEFKDIGAQHKRKLSQDLKKILQTLDLKLNQLKKKSKLLRTFEQFKKWKEQAKNQLFYLSEELKNEVKLPKLHSHLQKIVQTWTNLITIHANELKEIYKNSKTKKIATAIEKEVIQFCEYVQTDQQRKIMEEFERDKREFQDEHNTKVNNIAQGIAAAKINAKSIVELDQFFEIIDKESEPYIINSFKLSINQVWQRELKTLEADNIFNILKTYNEIDGVTIDPNKTIVAFLKKTQEQINYDMSTVKKNIEYLVSKKLSILKAQIDENLKGLERQTDKDLLRIQGTMRDNINLLLDSSKSKEFGPVIHRKFFEAAEIMIDCLYRFLQMMDLKKLFDDKPIPGAYDLMFGIRCLGPIVEELLKKSEELKKSLDGEKISKVTNYESIVKEFKQKTTQCHQFIARFSLKDPRLETADETGIRNELIEFKKKIDFTEAYSNTMPLVGGSGYDLRGIREKFNNEVRQIQAAVKESIAKLDKELPDTEFKHINFFSMTLNVYYHIFPNTHKTDLKTLISQKLLSDEKTIETLLNGIQTEISSMTNKNRDINTKLNRKKQNEEAQMTKKFNEQHKNTTQEYDRRIGAAEKEAKQQLLKEKAAKLEGLVKMNKEQKDLLAKRIVDQQSKEKGDAERELLRRLNGLSSQLIRLKRIAMSLSIAKDLAEMIIAKAIKNFGTNSKKYTNLLAKVFEESGSAQGLAIIQQHTCFQGYNAKKFKDLIKNNGINYVVNNIPNINKKTKDQLQQNFKKYEDEYENITKSYSVNPSEFAKRSLKNETINFGKQLEKDYDKSGASNRGVKLLGMIFALWTILKADVSEDGVEYLYSPHPAQIASLLLTLGIAGNNGKLGKRLAEVLTGEGKSYVLAGLSAYMALTGFEVDCVCYSRMLSLRDYETFKLLFDTLDIGNKITYGTFGQITEKLFCSKQFDLRDLTKDILIGQQRGVLGKIGRFFKNGWEDLKKLFSSDVKRVMIIDEVDVFFSKDFFGKLYSPATTIKSPEIEALANYIWNHRGSVDLGQAEASRQYQACLRKYSLIPQLLKQSLGDMVASVKNFNHSYVIHENKIGYVLPEGLSFEANYGWKTIFAYYHEAGKGTIKMNPSDRASLSILCCELSYAALPTYYKHIMGVTGTLQILPNCQRTVLQQQYNIMDFYYIPSVYGAPRRTILGAIVVSQPQHFKVVAKKVGDEVNKGRPVLVYFSDIQVMNEFYHSEDFKNLKGAAITIDEKNDANAVSDRVFRATRPRNITLLTKAFGRGFDFIVGDKAVKEAKGVHVIQTYISEEESEAKQTEGRTARQGNEGSYELILNNDSLGKYKIDFETAKKMEPMNLYKQIEQKRRIIFDEQYAEQIKLAKNCERNHKQSMKLIQQIGQNKSEQVIKAVTKINQASVVYDSKAVKTVIGIDATGSMGHAIEQVKNNLKECIRRVCQILKEKGVNKGFQIQIVAYRNYSSDYQTLFEWSPFSNNFKELQSFLSKIYASGGMGNEAVENLYHHVLYEEPHVDQVIVIGDAPGNTQQQIAQKRQYKGESYWSRYPRFARPINSQALVNLIASKNIPIHSFYIGKYPGPYFQTVSSKTKGHSEEYNYLARDAADMLTGFIVQQILQRIGKKVGGDKMGQDLVNAYRMRFSR